MFEKVNKLLFKNNCYIPSELTQFYLQREYFLLIHKNFTQFFHRLIYILCISAEVEIDLSTTENSDTRDANGNRKRNFGFLRSCYRKGENFIIQVHF